MTATSTRTRKRSGLRILLWTLGILLFLFIVAYLFLTSSVFFRRVVVPRIGQALNAEVTVLDAAVHPFSEVSVSGLKVQTTGDEPLLTAKTLRARYSLLDILRGTISVEEILIDTPVINLVKNPDGTSNLDPILQASAQEPEPQTTPTKPPGPSEPAQVRLKKLALQNGTLRTVEKFAGAHRNVSEVSGLNLTVTGIQNGQAGRVNLAAQVRVDNQPPAPGTNGTLQARLEGNLGFTLSTNLQPTAILGSTQLAVERAQGAMSDLAGLAADLVCELTPQEIKLLALRFKKGDADLGEARVTGPFDAMAQEGTLRLEIVSIDRQVLNLLGAAGGLDFRDTTINSTNMITLAQAGRRIAARGLVRIDRLSVTQQGQTTPPLDLFLDYDTSLDQEKQTAQLQSFTLRGTQNGQPLLLGELTRPMELAWSQNAPPAGDSTLRLSLTNFHLADWRSILGDLASAGDLHANLNLVAKEAGQKLSLDLTSQIDGLTATVASNQISQVNARLLLRGQVDSFQKVHLEQTRLELARPGQVIASAASSGDYNLESQAADLQLTLEVSLPGLLAVLPQPGMDFSSGTVALQGRVTQGQDRQTLAGTLAFSQLTGNYDQYRLADLNLNTDLDAEVGNQTLQLRKLQGQVRRAGLEGGRFDLTGSHHLETQAGEMTIKLQDLNQNFLEPFLAPALTNLTLVSVSLGGDSHVRYEPNGDATVRTDVRLSNLVVRDPGRAKPLPPLEAGLKLDMVKAREVMSLNQLQLNLTPTERAKNELHLTGQVDLSDTNVTQGRLQLASEALDLTRYYDLFVAQPGETAPAAPPTRAPARPAEPAKPEAEPEPMELPFKDFIFGIEVGRLYLREVVITNWQATLKLDRSRVVLDPFHLNLNGAPVNLAGDVDVGVPGYRYDLKLDTGAIPLEPIVNTFMPEEQGRYRGQLLAQTDIKGAGVTGSNLRKNLQGQMSLQLSNAVIQVVSPLYRNFLVPIGALLGVPELPETPLNGLVLGTQMGAGKIDLQRLHVATPAFLADTSGQIQISDVLANSSLNNWPMSFALRRSLAEKVRLVPSDASTNATYVQLPSFLHVGGSLGDPSAKIDAKALALSGLEKYADKIPGLDKETSQMIKGVAGFLSGKSSQTNQAGPTNQAGQTNQTNQATNQPPPIFNPFDLLKKKPQ